ncbi:hypothetical protein P175DRAFT_0511616 [Aspergillus ochraceoroseus IBT 24754]|uniref:NYN domain-containing protein n=1 Tax=Aspergillus ochraceoroseus IBT 24754 TaxID=1392256 RepID=A0A2T5LPG2_9EURO|nr:uncharacterized protein P175DRAFT_0511616 [Aspergillus ochraceoroseus IBT 24754]PTU18168.1 hypothetical protein P175DRAFT_0511616 [Aspergillus ochraceoroseus IBT 24754]
MSPSSSSTSNWDFTPVINLLRSSPCQSGDHPVLDHRLRSSTGRSGSHPSNTDDVKTPSIQAGSLKHANSYSNIPRLGDFGALWELLGSTSSSPTPVDHRSHREEIQTPPSILAPHPTKPIVIFKRPPTTTSDVEQCGATSQPSPKHIPLLTCTEPCDDFLQEKIVIEPRTPRRNDHTRTGPRHERSSSESNAGGESDGAVSVFDRPFVKKQRGARPMVPPQIGIAEAIPEAFETPPSSFDELDEFLTPNGVKYMPSTGTIRVQPLAYKSAADRRVGLLTKLLNTFPDYADLIVQAGRSGKSKEDTVSTRPIHVFVDMSNIMVGFHDTMKISRNIPIKTRIRRLPLSFQSFSLILERGRPTAKRILVGSDRFAAISEGKLLGYEANILDRVQKVKQPTSRQLKYRKNPRVGSHEAGHGSETNDAPEERWVEQGVDEILHLKILESLLDTDKPATIVLATGDAAEAEFSGGFMKMVERALQRGWRVELISFSQVTSYAMTTFTTQDLYGGAIKGIIPEGWLDASDLRQIPDHQEIFLSPTTLSHVIIEVNERVAQETALAGVRTRLQDLTDFLGANPEATPETIDKAAALYHINDIRENGEADHLRIVLAPHRVAMARFPAAMRVRAYKGVVALSSSERARGGGVVQRVSASIGGAAAGSSADGALGSTVSCHYLLVRLEEQDTDVLVLVNVPHREFDENGDPRGLSREEELASELVEGLVEKLHVVDWGLFG